MTIRRLEEISMNAWPSLQTIQYDGWVVRMANGYTKRANSASPLYPSSIKIEDKIAYCEKLFAGHGLETAFKMNRKSLPSGLDAALEGLGYRACRETSVQAMPLAGFAPGSCCGVEYHPHFSDEWLEAAAGMHNLDLVKEETLAWMLGNIRQEAVYVLKKAGGEAAGCGLGVLEDGFVGVFDIIVLPECRRMGYGREIVDSIIDWGVKQGAHTAYLQVMKDNAPALALYGKIGFREFYGYWYRIK